MTFSKPTCKKNVFLQAPLLRTLGKARFLYIVKTDSVIIDPTGLFKTFAGPAKQSRDVSPGFIHWRLVGQLSVTKALGRPAEAGRPRVMSVISR